jgi:hypothetical protein
MPFLLAISKFSRDNPTLHNKGVGKTMGGLFKNTTEKDNAMTDAGYNLVAVWKYAPGKNPAFEDWLKKNSATDTMTTALILREAFIGERNNVTCFN